MTLHVNAYRLWDSDGITSLGPILAKPVAYVLNTVADLLRIQGEFSSYPPEEAKKLLAATLKTCPKNGIETSIEIKQKIESIVSVLEAVNPTVHTFFSIAFYFSIRL